jgi:hypothetical protein
MIADPVVHFARVHFRLRQRSPMWVVYRPLYRRIARDMHGPEE